MIISRHDIFPQCPNCSDINKTKITFDEQTIFSTYENLIFLFRFMHLFKPLYEFPPPMMIYFLFFLPSIYYAVM